MVYNSMMGVILVILLSFFSWKALLTSGFFQFHDFQQVARLFEFNKALLAGQFPVRWVPDLGFGYGYALFNFYPPLTYYMGEVFHLIGFGFIDATKIVWAIALMGSAVAMYFLSKEFFGKWGAVVSAVLYLYAPYHAIDAYVRGALAELLSFVWLPLILLFSYKKRYFLTAITLAGLMLTHNLIFLPFVGFYLLWSRNFRSLALAMALTAFFWLPSLVEKQYTLVDQLLTRDLASYKIHFVCLDQLWNSPWGFGGSVAGCLDGLSFKIGKLHLILAALSIVLLKFQKDKKIISIVLISSLSLLTAIFMATSYSQFIWDNVQPLWYLQFPWRFLEFVVLFTSFLAGAVVLAFKQKQQILLTIIIVAATLYLNVKYFVPQSYDLSMSDESLLTDQQLRWNVSKTSFEYMPQGIAVFRNDKGEPLPQAIFDATKINLNSNFVPAQFTQSVYLDKPTQLQFPVTNFPGWTLYVDGVKQQIEDNNDLKLITATVPQGQHIIVGKFENTLPRVVGNAMSLISVGAIVIYLIYERRKSRASGR